MATLNIESRGYFGIIFLVVVVGCLQASSGEVYTVGDSAGWTTKGNVDYKQWAATKTFKIGDVIVFQYNAEYHNVMEVKHADFRACNVSSPITTSTTGNDSITLTTLGHHFFVCGVPGHCQAGQKVDINVLRSNSTTLSPPATPPEVVTTNVPAPAPTPSAAAPLRGIYAGLLIALALASVSVFT